MQPHEERMIGGPTGADVVTLLIAVRAASLRRE
jgi:hypothetical protein